MKKVFAFILGCFIAALTFAQKPELPLFKENGSLALVARLSTSRAYDNQLWLDISTGPVVTNALRVYSDPSHTLVAVIVDSAFSQTVEGQKWLASFPKGNAVILFVKLPLASVSIRVPDFPSADEGLRLWVNGDFFGNYADMLVGGYGFGGPAHVFGGIIYFPKVSAEEFKEYLDAAPTAVGLASLIR